MEDLAQESDLTLDLGCGERAHPDADVRVDIYPTDSADILATLDTTDGIEYLPFEDEVASAIYLRHTLEHLTDLDHILAECCRVSVPDARIHVTIPYYNSLNAAADPTHKIAHKMTEHLWTYYDNNPLSYETGGANISVEEIDYVYRQRGLVQRILPDFLKYQLRHEIGNLVEEIQVKLRVVK